MSMMPNLNIFPQCRINYNKINSFSLTVARDLVNIQNILEEHQVKLFYELRPPNLSKESNSLNMLPLAVNCAFSFISFEHSG